MFGFPGNTAVGRRLPKEAFYRHLSLSAALKDRFISDVDRIIVENSLTKSSLNLDKDAKIKEILLLGISLKKQKFDRKIIEAIARQNPHKLIFLLQYGDERQLAVYYSKLYRTEWKKEKDLSLTLSGGTLDEIWESLVSQIAIHSDPIRNQKKQPLDEQLKKQEEADRLNKLIKKTEAAAWRQQQPKKRFELYTRLQEYKSQLEEITKNDFRTGNQER